MSALRLVDLVRPLKAPDFVDEHWLKERPFLSASNPVLVERLHSIELLRDVDLLLKKRTAEAGVFGPRQFRASIRASEAANFVRHGYTLYLTDVEKTVPEASALFAGICDELGMPAWAATVQMFIAQPGAVSSVHYDHDVNFQILLEGEKEWAVAPNEHIRNPMDPYHPLFGPDGEDVAFKEEAIARDSRVPTQMPPRAAHYLATPGTVTFLPRGHWHEVHTRSRSIAINLVFQGDSWGAGIARALHRRLSADEAARGYLGGVLSKHNSLRAHARAQFETVRAHAMKQLAELTIEEALVSWPDLSWTWAARTKDRVILEEAGIFVLIVAGQQDEAIELDPVTVPFLRKLIALRRRFSWDHVLHLVGPALRDELPAHAVMNLLGSLVEQQLLET